MKKVYSFGNCSLSSNVKETLTLQNYACCDQHECASRTTTNSNHDLPILSKSGVYSGPLMPPTQVFQETSVDSLLLTPAKNFQHSDESSLRQSHSDETLQSQHGLYQGYVSTQQIGYCQCFDCLRANAICINVKDELFDITEAQPKDYTTSEMHLRGDASSQDMHLSKEVGFSQLSAIDANFKSQIPYSNLERSVCQDNFTQRTNCLCCQTSESDTYDSTMQQQATQQSVNCYPVYYQDFVSGY